MSETAFKCVSADTVSPFLPWHYNPFYGALSDLYDQERASGVGHHAALRRLARRIGANAETVGRTLARARSGPAVVRDDRHPNVSSPCQGSAAVTSFSARGRGELRPDLTERED